MDLKYSKSLFSFIIVYILIVFPLTLFTDEIFPLSRFPMYSKNTLIPCGYIVLESDEKILALGTREALTFLEYINENRLLINSCSNSSGENCELISERYIKTSNYSGGSLTFLKYCVYLNLWPDLETKVITSLTCKQQD